MGRVHFAFCFFMAMTLPAQADAVELILETGPSFYQSEHNDDGMFRVQVEQLTEKPLRTGTVFGHTVTMKPAVSFGQHASMRYVGAELPWRWETKRSYMEASWGLVWLFNQDESLTGTQWQHQLSILRAFRISDHVWVRFGILHTSNGKGYAGGSGENPGQNYLTSGIIFRFSD